MEENDSGAGGRRGVPGGFCQMTGCEEFGVKGDTDAARDNASVSLIIL